MFARQVALLLLAAKQAIAFTPLPAVPSSLNTIKRGVCRGRNSVVAAAPITCGCSVLSSTAALGSSALAALCSTPTSSSAIKGLAMNTALFAPLVLKGQSMLTATGVLSAWVLGSILWATLGWQGWSVCVVYLLAGSMVTKVKMTEKTELGISEGRGGRRGPENVWGSAATGALCALATQRWPAQRSLLVLGFVASMSTKLSDTFQSEIGKAYGKRCFLITSLKPVPRGTEGAVSLEGYLAGIVGSLVIAGVAAALRLIDLKRLAPLIKM